MAARWGASSEIYHPESGILRKTKPKDNPEDLLVFGYACKLFRDDEKAAYIDKGNHLIPWMGDDKLKIDRYDCRGALSDLSIYEASKEGFDAMRWLGLSKTDRKLEQTCDQERYYALHINEEEEEMYKDEEQKRQKANEFQYSYDVPQDPAAAAPVPPGTEDDDEEYVPAPRLDVPVDISIPKTVKENARIEKTASFVAKQGLQMEILIKAKQAGNAQFSFLNQGDQLYKYYRHVLAAVKNGRYEVGAMTDVKQDSHDGNNSGDEHYLHPSLSASSAVPADVHFIPQIPYKPSANCAYSQLVNRIQGNTAVEAAQPPLPTQPDEKSQQQYYQYYYAAQYYEYYKQMAQLQQNGTGTPPDAPSPSQLDPAVQSYIQQMAYAQYVQNQTTNPYAQIVSNVANKEVTNPYAALLANLPPPPIKEPPVGVAPEKAEPPAKRSVLPLADYGTDSDDYNDDAVPTGESQVVIDKMASYVAKNGEQFEDIVKAKGDPRFEFLTAGHDFHWYYKKRIREIKGEVVKSPKDSKKIIAPVSFSIKKPKDESPKEIKSALPLESDDESNQSESVVATPPMDPPIEESDPDVGVVYDGDDPILEMIDLTGDLEERKDAKRAEDKIKDKLAAAAREKMVSVARDRALQLERKRKAAAFLKLKLEENKPPEVAATVEAAAATPPPDSRTSETVVEIDDSCDEDEKKRKSSRRRKSHKRKHSKSKHESRSKKKLRKKKRRSESCSSTNSKSA